MITSNEGVLAVICGICALIFFLENRFPKLFNYVPGLIWIYITPMILTNAHFIADKSEVYDVLKNYAIPMFIVIMLIEVDIKSIFKVLGPAVGVFLFGAIGVVVGGVVGFSLFKTHLPADGWKAIGAISGSWIGGTGNMAAVAAGLNISSETLGLAVLTDGIIFSLWIPFLLISKNYNKLFIKLCGTPKEIFKNIELKPEKSLNMSSQHFIYLLAISFCVLWFSRFVSGLLPEIKPVLTTSTYEILIVTSVALCLSFTKAREIPGTRSVATALIYIFMASMGAKAVITNLSAIPWFIVTGVVWIIIHAIFTLIGARVFKMDIGIAAISSAANVGGVASATVVASVNDSKLIPVGILLALLGYAIGNYFAFLAAQICSMI